MLFDFIWGGELVAWKKWLNGKEHCSSGILNSSKAEKSTRFWLKVRGKGSGPIIDRLCGDLLDLRAPC